MNKEMGINNTWLSKYHIITLNLEIPLKDIIHDFTIRMSLLSWKREKTSYKKTQKAKISDLEKAPPNGQFPWLTQLGSCITGGTSSKPIFNGRTGLEPQVQPLAWLGRQSSKSHTEYYWLTEIHG